MVFYKQISERQPIYIELPFLFNFSVDTVNITCSEEDGVKVYEPNLRREDAAQRETGNFLNRVHKGSVSMMMSAITQKQELTREEIDELYAILRQAEEGRQDR